MMSDKEKIAELEMRVQLLEKKLALCLEKLDKGQLTQSRTMQFKKFQEIDEMSLLDFDEDVPS